MYARKKAGEEEKGEAEEMVIARWKGHHRYWKFTNFPPLIFFVPQHTHMNARSVRYEVNIVKSVINDTGYGPRFYAIVSMFESVLWIYLNIGSMIYIALYERSKKCSQSRIAMIIFKIMLCRSVELNSFVAVTVIVIDMESLFEVRINTSNNFHSLG